jgi:outer membrane protein assembly factor BamB
VVQLEGLDSSPAVGADGTIYVGAGESLVALEPTAGTEKWRFLTAGDVESSPTLAPDGTLYVGADDAKVYALDSQTGAFKWSFSFPEGSTTDSSPALGADGTVYIGSDEGMLVALQGNNGRLKWTFTAAGEIRGAPAIGSDGTVYVSVVGPAESETQTYAIDGRTGLPRWVQALPSDFATSVALVNGPVFLGQ